MDDTEQQSDNPTDDTTPEKSIHDKPQSRRFTRRSDVPKLTPDAVSRQGTVTRLAFEALGKDRAITYLNTDSTVLGGRPLALATATIEGFDRVLADIAMHGATHGAAPGNHSDNNN